jgi:flagellar hook-associated protein 1 FlgK
MSLFSSIQLANNTLRANQIGLQVTGQNIANANTPGYIREEVAFNAAPTQRLGTVLLGLGVEVTGVIQKIDHYLEQRLRGATSERVAGEIEEQTHLELEVIYGELSDTDLSTALTDFFNSIQEIATQPESAPTRRVAVEKGKTLAANINQLYERALQMRIELNSRVEQTADDINRLTEEIRGLNLRISEAEATDISASDAVGLRDQRHSALTKLAELIDIQVYEQPTGMVSVYNGGEYLVLDGDVRTVKASEYSDRGLTVFELRLVDTNKPLEITGGEVGGLVKSRDDVLGGFLDTLDNFSGTLIGDFNRLYASGQGLSGYQSLTSEWGVESTTVALDSAGLPFTPTNGSFELQVYSDENELTETTVIPIDLNGLDSDATLASLAAAIDAVDGVSASINDDNQLVITTDSADASFAFGDDTSGILAALGINTFFSGSDARTIGVNSYVAADALKFAASRGGIGEDEKMSLDLVAFQQQPLDSQEGLTIWGSYERMTGTIAQNSSVAQAVASGARVFEDQLKGQSLAISGVSIDEEILKMIRYQRSFQASAKYIQTLDELLGILVAI